MKKKALYIILTVVSAAVGTISGIFAVSTYRDLSVLPSFNIGIFFEIIGWAALMVLSVIAAFYFIVCGLKIDDKKEKEKK